ncbi:hypothetical protein Microterr_03130 [Microbacterium terricola]|uniref:Cell division initiation protein n=1 Tax=Microbacterium terricola TaxID=344163 RepID=A0ABM8DVI5_9MICO|nr:hypothetical protein Microterr_03130 [Microbacterium terricola]
MPSRTSESDGRSPFDELIGAGVAAAAGTSFATAFRGYDRDEVDAAIAGLQQRQRADAERIAELQDENHRAAEAATRSRKAAERLEARTRQAESAGNENVERLEAELAAAVARAADADQKVQALSDELVGASGESANKERFEEILRVAEDQASLLIRNATVQAERLLDAAREEILNRRKETQAEAAAIIAQAENDAQQARLRIDTETTAHQAQIEREAAHAAEKVSQAEQEAAAIRTEAEKGAAALRSMVARETERARSEAEDAVRELRVRALEFEESLTRRQDDAQQEFLVLHNQAVAHAERITQDANEQVTASLEHAQRVAAKAEDFEKLMRAQAQQTEADANLRAREHLDRAHVKAQKIIDTVTAHSQSVLRDAEDRTRQLRWQQQQLTSFMAEVREMIRPEAPLEDEATGADDAADDTAPSDDAEDSAAQD